MKLYICHYPGCQYTTTSRNKIEFHHIIPRELWPRLNQNVILTFCPTHHRLIYHPECKSGPHSIKADDSLIIDGIYRTTKGYSVIFHDIYGHEISNDFDK